MLMNSSKNFRNKQKLYDLFDRKIRGPYFSFAYSGSEKLTINQYTIKYFYISFSFFLIVLPISEFINKSF